MTRKQIDTDYLLKQLEELLSIPSPSGFTDEIVRYTCGELTALGVKHELTRRGAIRANLKGKESAPNRAVVAHLDTIGAMVKNLKDNGRLEVVPIGTWSSRFAEGARVTLFTDEKHLRGTVLPLKASGHTFDEEVDTQPISWQNVELRIDEPAYSKSDLEQLGIHVGDVVAVDPNLEISDSGFINSRHLDDKAAVAVLLSVIKLIVDNGEILPVDCHVLFTISEEVGSGASHVLQQDAAEMVTLDTATLAPGQNTGETGVTIAMKDSAGPYDYHLTRKLIGLCGENDIECHRDVFLFYRSDSASAIDAGNDIRTALVCFGNDATHGWERCRLSSLQDVGSLLYAYMNSAPTVMRDKEDLSSIKGFTHMPIDTFDE